MSAMKAVQKYSLDSEYKQTESFSQYNKQYAFLSKQYTKNLNKPSKKDREKESHTSEMSM